MKYAILDLSNIFHRGRHVASKNADTWTQIGMALHLALASVNYVVRKFDVDHTVAMLEGKSWRKAMYKPYKANRAVDPAAVTEKQQEENELFWKAYEDLTTYLREKTNISVIRHPYAEADDLIARFIALHPDDEHFIISSDTDFHQLISENVKQYNGITGQLITLDGYYDDLGRPVKDKKTGEHKKLEEPAYILFKKIIRGDTTDNIFSAYPGAREKSSKSTVGIREAYEDFDRKGFKYNNFMLSRWLDHDGNEHLVKDDYERNKILIDLSAIPDNIKNEVDAEITESVRKDLVSNVGIHLLKFCSKYELNRISDQAEGYTKWLNKAYPG